MNAVESFVTELVGPMQDIEDAFQTLLIQRRLDTAEGAQLDVLGSIVGAERAGYDDDTYRRIIGVTILVLRSNGSTEDLIAIAVAVAGTPTIPRGTVRVYNDGPATVVVRVERELDFEIAALLIRFLRTAVDGGVRVILEDWQSDEDAMFAFEPFSGTAPGFGFGSELDASVGGILAGALE